MSMWVDWQVFALFRLPVTPIPQARLLWDYDSQRRTFLPVGSFWVPLSTGLVPVFKTTDIYKYYSTIILFSFFSKESRNLATQKWGCCVKLVASLFGASLFGVHSRATHYSTCGEGEEQSKGECQGKHQTEEGRLCSSRRRNSRRRPWNRLRAPRRALPDQSSRSPTRSPASQPPHAIEPTPHGLSHSRSLSLALSLARALSLVGAEGEEAKKQKTVVSPLPTPHHAHARTHTHICTHAHLYPLAAHHVFT